MLVRCGKIVVAGKCRHVLLCQMQSNAAAEDASSREVSFALAALCLFWGGTFFAIRLAVESIPPFSMMAIRCFSASCLLLLISRVKGGGWPTSSQWRTGVVAGIFLFLGCHGLLAMEEQHVPSSVAALIGATVPLWMVVFDALRPGGSRPTRSVIIGLVLGLVGMAILGASENRIAADGTLLWGMTDAFVLLASSASWAIGSLYGRRARGPSSAANTAAQLASGAIALAIGAIWRGEWASEWWQHVA